MRNIRGVALALLVLALLPFPVAFAEGEELTLASLTISPNPEKWETVWGPEIRESGGHFDENPPATITVTAVPQNPGVTFTIRPASH